MSTISTIDEEILAHGLSAPGRGVLTSARLEEHLRITSKRLKKLGVTAGDRIGCLLPEGPDATTAAMTARIVGAEFAQLHPAASTEEYESRLIDIAPKLVLMHSDARPAREAAQRLGIPVANVLRHFEAGVFTLESAISLPHAPSARRSVPLVLIAPGLAYRRLASRLDAINQVIGITPPSLDLLHPPHTFEHVAAESVRLLKRYKPRGPYAIAGLRAEGLIALEMARLLEAQGDYVRFVALLDPSELFYASTRRWARAIRRAIGLVRRRFMPSSGAVAEAVRLYRPAPWYGKILHIRSTEPAAPSPQGPWLDWREVAPHGVVPYESRGEMLGESNALSIASILAGELGQPVLR